MGGRMSYEGGRECCICSEEYRGHGHNPAPVKAEGRCCDRCNYVVVLPARVKEVMDGSDD